MKITAFMLLLMMIPLSTIQAANKILFVGNSFTARNNLPNMVKKIAKSNDVNMDVYKNLSPGASWMDFSHDYNTLRTLKSKDWHAIVFQEQSFFLARTRSKYLVTSLPPLRVLDNNSITRKTVLFQTWGYLNGDTSPLYNGNYTDMQDRLIDGYNDAADYISLNNRTRIARVGEVWKTVFHNRLYSDTQHPSIEGSYLASCVLFRTIANNRTVKLNSWKPSLVPRFMRKRLLTACNSM